MRVATPAQIFGNVSTCREVGSAGQDAGQSGARVKYIGRAPDVGSCARAATAWRNASAPADAARCRSACWFGRPKNASFADQCYCRVDQAWLPLPSLGVDAAQILLPCGSDRDCSFNGQCRAAGAVGGADPTATTNCECEPGWGGAYCGELRLLPVNASQLGYRRTTLPDGGGHVGAARPQNVSSWGASVHWDAASGRWHGWASEMREHCGINAWETNSQVVHVVGSSPLGPFERRETVWPAFAHEPTVSRGPRGEWAMLYSSYPLNAAQLAASLCVNCSDGNTPPLAVPGIAGGCPFERGEPKALGHPFRQMLAVSTAGPDGPWDAYNVEIPQLTVPWDWNTAMEIQADGSAVALIRGGMTWHAANYSDPASWRAVGGSGGQGEGPQWDLGVEDPFIWSDGVGRFHALAHGFSPFFGVHAIAVDGPPLNWTDGTPMRWEITGAAYGNRVAFTDGTVREYTRRERPHLVFGSSPEQQQRKQPIALVNGVQYGGAPNQPFGDGVYTLVQPIQGAATAGPGQ
jgi:hypothetical protein